MSRAPDQPRDPLAWCAIIALAFWLLVLANLAIPTAPYFDEVHYLPAARELLAMGDYTNREHPLLGKELLAAGIALLGDNSWGWRIFPSLAGALALFAAMRALWFSSCSRFATLAYGVLLATGFALFVHARIAMLDIFMVAFLCVAAWQMAGAMREPETGRWRLALTGAALGLAMAAKWNAIPLAVLPGLAFLMLRWRAGRRRLLLSRRGAPVPGITLAEAALWLGAVPLLVYAATFIPAYCFANGAIEGGLIAHHREMLSLQTQVLSSHPYQSSWPDWVINWRAIWYLYELVDGAQRGVMLIGNPLTMLLGLPALFWCLWQGMVRRRAAHGAVVLLYAVSLGFWMVAPKSVQFYYHYFLPGMVLLAALALSMDDLREAGWRKSALAVLAASMVLFAGFYPILSAAPLEGVNSFTWWTWLISWR
ncbi:phospholipid carrier-dependent glycosyltransferase [Qipengyuania marisflavi]|uniref:Polyprenol-phosphate-mannose--protein mannosyltransferase n=1 Tax=Qipengyuania marisflavi TaxID=2486356 RepID=A0A5S3Q1L0_9SPHN|nr:phospholipid carrier-dependent glycosyltransferase [Qipengyuania marisflavi]TMM50257.1 phospholipid carrier-dependent glycosyltransferase [Qipengyuania marisflavi]